VLNTIEEPRDMSYKEQWRIETKSHAQIRGSTPGWIKTEARLAQLLEGGLSRCGIISTCLLGFCLLYNRIRLLSSVDLRIAR
jgi:hypothetical protein